MGLNSPISIAILSSSSASEIAHAMIIKTNTMITLNPSHEVQLSSLQLHSRRILSQKYSSERTTKKKMITDAATKKEFFQKNS